MPPKLERVRQYLISKQVLEALQPLLFFTYLFGLTPFRIVKNKTGDTNVRMSCFGFCNIALYIALYGICYIITLLQAESVVGYFFRTQISSIGDNMQICNGLITGTVIYVSAITLRHKLLEVIDILYNLDENFVNIGVKVKYTRTYRFSIVLLMFKKLIIGVYVVGVFALLKSVNITPSFFVCVTFFLQHSVLSLTICLFCILAYSFERRLVILNKGASLWNMFSYIIILRQNLSG